MQLAGLICGECRLVVDSCGKFAVMWRRNASFQVKHSVVSHPAKVQARHTREFYTHVAVLFLLYCACTECATMTPRCVVGGLLGS